MAFIRINQIKDADGSIEPDELELANDIIESMLITRKGSIPGSRGFGLTQIFIDILYYNLFQLLAIPYRLELVQSRHGIFPRLLRTRLHGLLAQVRHFL